jgi:hypothetical protein
MENERIDNWEQKREHLKKEFPNLTEDDLLYEVGREEELLTRLQEKLNKNKHEIRKWLSLMS